MAPLAYIGRVRNHDVERPIRALREVDCIEADSRGDAEPLGISRAPSRAPLPKYRWRRRAPPAARSAARSRSRREPVPRSQMRHVARQSRRALPRAPPRPASRCRAAARASPRSASNGRPQNSFSPRMRATGSPASRRFRWASKRRFASAGSSSPLARDQRRHVEAGSGGEKQARVERGVSMPAPRKRRARLGQRRAVGRHAASPSNSESFRAWSSAISASTTSSSASPREHLVELVEGEVDAVVGHPPLRKIVGADALRAVARADLALARRRRARSSCFCALQVVEPRAQHLHARARGSGAATSRSP